MINAFSSKVLRTASSPLGVVPQKMLEIVMVAGCCDDKHMGKYLKASVLTKDNKSWICHTPA